MDRVISMILGTSSIREVIAFPKNRRAFCPMTGAPSGVADTQLAELGLGTGGPDQSLPGAAPEADLMETLSWVSRIQVDDSQKSAVRQALNQAQAMAQDINSHARDLNGREPLYTVFPATNRTREGTRARRHVLAKNKDLFKNAPAVTGDFFKVAGILE
jgi:aspartyl-tRNA synthetase